jgi:MFS family permease
VGPGRRANTGWASVVQYVLIVPASLFRQREFALLFAGQTISTAGTAINTLALPLVALTVLHASPLAVSLVTAADQIGWLVIGLVAGVWVDRVRRRPVMIGADLARAALVATVPAAWALDALTLAHLVGVALLVGLLTVLFDVAYPAYLPAVVARERLVEGNGHLQAGQLTATIVGPGLGGVLVQALGAPVALLADSASYFASAASISGIRTAEPVSDRTERPGLRADLAEGLRHVWRNTLTRVNMTVAPVANFVFGGYNAVHLVFLYREVHVPPGLIGVLLAFAGAGGVAGAVLVNRLAARLGDARVITYATAVVALFGLLIPLTHGGAGLAWFAVGAFGLDFGLVCYNVCILSAIQTVTPPRLMGRVTASIRLVSRTVMPLGALVGGVLATAFSARTALVLLLVLQLFVPVRVWFSPVGRVRRTAELMSRSA